MTKAKNYPTCDKSLIGAAGVHFVASHLSMRGLIALPTTRNIAGVDVVVVNKEGTWQANLQVKTSRILAKYWLVGKHSGTWRGRHNHYVFVRYNPAIVGFEAFLESSECVARKVEEEEDRGKQRGCKPFSGRYFPGTKADLGRLQRQWEEFGRKESAEEQDHD